MRFRHDINGLRAIAVTAVLLFHFEVPGFYSGFLGVDIFFVISGFLMAGILLRGLEGKSEKWNLNLVWVFYFARARRILPALLVLVCVLLLVGWWTLGPEDYERLAKHARASLFFSSNHQFFNESGYFDLQSHEKWLLHTWTLSVEWQFYLLLPLLVILLWRVKPDRRFVLWALGFVTALSFAFGVERTSTNPEAAFYLLPSRAWELMVGACVYLLTTQLLVTPRWVKSLEVLGLALIGMALILNNKTTPWPGSAALLPVLGTSLVLLAGNHSPAWAMSSSIQWLGKSSYSLYLWHWPFFVVLVFLDLQTQTWAIFAGISLSLVFAATSYKFVEQTALNTLSQLSRKWAVVTLIAATSGISLAALIISKYDGLPDRMPDVFNNIMAETNNRNPYRHECHGHPKMASLPWCVIGGEEIKAVVIGDSHASNIVTAVRDTVLSSPQHAVVMSTYTSCQPLLGIKKINTRLKCAEFNKFIDQKLSNLHPDVPLIIASRLSSAIFGSHLIHDKNHNIPSLYFEENPYTEVTETYLKEVHGKIIESACFWSRNRTVYWLTPFPEFPNDAPRWLARRVLLTDAAELSINRTEYDERNRFVKSALADAENQCPNFKVVDVATVFCDDQRCYGSKNGMPLLYDEHHLSERGNRLLLPLFKEKLGLQ